jgi:lipocalin-like protein
MYGRQFVLALFGAALVLLPDGTFAQQQQQSTEQAQQSIKSLLPGAWYLILIDGIDAEGINHPLFGPNPEGIATFTANGHMALEVMRSNRPRFASGNRDKGSAEENMSTVHGTLAYYGTYTVDEAGKALTEHIEGSTFPNLEGAKRPLKVVQITDEVMTLDLPIAQSTIPGQGGFKSILTIWKKFK